MVSLCQWKERAKISWVEKGLHIIKSNFKVPLEVVVVTETGYEIRFKLRPRTYLDMNKKTFPFFFCEFYGQYLGTSAKSKAMSYTEANTLLKDRTIEQYWESTQTYAPHI